MGVGGEGGEAIDLLENTQVEPCRLDVLESAEGLVVLGEDADDLFGGVVGCGDDATFDSVNQSGPVPFQEGKEGLCFWFLGDELLALGQHVFIATLGRALGLGIKDTHHLLAECFNLRMGFGVGVAIDLFEVLVKFLQGVKDTFVMSRLGKNMGDQWPVIDPHVSNDDTRVIAFGPESEQESGSAQLGVVGVELDVQQIVGVAIDGEIDVHPTSHLAFWFVILGHQYILFVDAHHAARTHCPKESGDGQEFITKATHPTIGCHFAHTQHLGRATVDAVGPLVQLQGCQMVIDRPARIGDQVRRQVGEGFVRAGGVVAVVAVHFYGLEFSLLIKVLFQAGLFQNLLR